MLDYVSIGKQFRQQRKNLNLTQGIVAHIAGLSLSYYGHIERGARIPSLETFVKIVDVLGLSADQVLSITPHA
ncbi:MAG: helix-turn-helix transcriptional regulator [Clostridia bacterium]|nr:helix-turn-helix transcriptional regulator [Clostridia bacterium]